MRVLVAGASGVVGRLLVPLLVADGHDVVALARTRMRAEELRASGVGVQVADVLDAEGTLAAVRRVGPEVIVHQLTDLAAGDLSSNARLRAVGTRSLVTAAKDVGADRFVAQSIAWVHPPGTSTVGEDGAFDPTSTEPRRSTLAGVRALESAVAELARGVVLRYGVLYGPGTWYCAQGRFGEAARGGALMATETVQSFLHVEDAARAAACALGWPSGVWNVVDDDPAPGHEWVPAFAAAVGADAPTVTESGDIGRPFSNIRARQQGLELRFPSWRAGFLTLEQSR